MGLIFSSCMERTNPFQVEQEIKARRIAFRCAWLLFYGLLRRYRRRIGGRWEVNARGRRRNRGAKGGGTFRRKSPQHGQRPSCEVAAVASARNQCPRASHS